MILNRSRSRKRTAGSLSSFASAAFSWSMKARRFGRPVSSSCIASSAASAMRFRFSRRSAWRAMMRPVRPMAKTIAAGSQSDQNAAPMAATQ